MHTDLPDNPLEPRTMTERNSIPFSSSFSLTFFYCLPAIIAILITAIDSGRRMHDVSNYIDQQRILVETAYHTTRKQAEQLPPQEAANYISANLEKNAQIKKALDKAGNSENTKGLINYYLSRYLENVGTTQRKSSFPTHAEINGQIYGVIWLGNTLITAIMILFPFFLLGTRYGFSKKLPGSYAERRKTVHDGWWMKLIVGLIMAYGWIYIINPQGRGASTITQFLINVDLAKDTTLPAFLSNMAITPVLAGFLGWYLYLLSYFFSKMTTNDVMSSQIYGVLFQKFLFTYGLSIIFPTDETTGAKFLNLNTIAFLIGYFPMSAFSIIKDTGIKVIQGVKAEKGQLSELPGISRWQILRLEEEGIDSMGALAYSPHEHLHHSMPAMSKLVDYWVDIARLYSIIGEEDYAKIKQYCLTASGFLERANDPEFAATVLKDEIGDAKEIARILTVTFFSHKQPGNR